MTPGLFAVNVLIWSVFMFLAWKTLSIAAAAWFRGRLLKQIAERFCTAHQVIQRRLREFARARQGSTKGNAVRLGDLIEEMDRDVSRKCAYLVELSGFAAEHFPERLLLRLVRFELRGHGDLARENLDLWQHGVAFRNDEAAIWPKVATNMGLLGTVLGAIVAFAATAASSHERFAALSLALYTTAAGLVLMDIIRVAIAVWLSPTVNRLELLSEELGHDIRDRSRRLRLQVRHAERKKRTAPTYPRRGRRMPDGQTSASRVEASEPMHPMATTVLAAEPIVCERRRTANETHKRQR